MVFCHPVYFEVSKDVVWVTYELICVWSFVIIPKYGFAFSFLNLSLIWTSWYFRVWTDDLVKKIGGVALSAFPPSFKIIVFRSDHKDLESSFPNILKSGRHLCAARLGCRKCLELEFWLDALRGYSRLLAILFIFLDCFGVAGLTLPSQELSVWSWWSWVWGRLKITREVLGRRTWREFSFVTVMLEVS